MTKISTQERDRTVRRYSELTISRGKEITEELMKEFTLASDEYDSNKAVAAIDRTLATIKRAMDYNDECESIERTLEELAADGDVRSISILNNEGIKKFREYRAEWIENVILKNNEKINRALDEAV